ncbi:MAG: [FeFe] hydrogenase H-cluster radical SAM maturase HydE [Bacillota bacterium]
MVAEEKLLVICTSTTDMLRADRLMRDRGIPFQPVPVPGELGSVCTTALEIDAARAASVAGLLQESRVSVAAIARAPQSHLSGLLEKLNEKRLSLSFRQVMEKLQTGEPLDREDIIVLLRVEDDSDVAALFKAGDLMRKRIVGDTVDVRACLEFSNHCRKNCLYCGLRRDNTRQARYRMSAEEILAVALKVHDAGIKTLILQSGEDPCFSATDICSLIREIKKRTGMRITLSIGERTREEYAAFRDAGANNYLLKIETANKKLFSYLHPGDRWEVRDEHAGWLKELGYITGSGNIVGLPGQTLEDLADDICYFRDAGVHMLGIGPFIPAPDTPLAVYPPGTALLTWKVIAAARLAVRNVFIPSTTALATLDRTAQQKGLAVGANTVMIIVTPEKYRDNYRIYPNKLAVDLKWTMEMIGRLNRKPPAGIKKGCI